jgi:hypothetical protein
MTMSLVRSWHALWRAVFYGEARRPDPVVVHFNTAVVTLNRTVLDPIEFGVESSR